MNCILAKSGNSKRCVKVGMVLATMLLVTFCVNADDATLPLSAPVKSLSTTSGDPQPAQNRMMVQAPQPQPTTPGGKLPQYQLGHHHRTVPAIAETGDPRLRLLVALPSAPILIEATITIDGQPFRMARERRIEQIIQEAAGPAPPQPNPTAAVTADVDETKARDPKTGDSEADDPEADDAEADVGEDSETPEAEPVSQPTVAAYTMPVAVSERMRRYMQATGAAASRDEVHWLLTNWVDGPTLLMLNDNFQRFRANQRPVFQVLDRDRDGTLSSDELNRAVESFNECDLNRNQIVDYAELAKIADDPRLKQAAHAGPGKLIFRIPDNKTAAATYYRIASRYQSADSESPPTLPRFDLNANGQFDPEELSALADMEPDVSLTVAFHSASPGESRIEVRAVKASFAEAIGSATVAASTITLPLGGTSVAFSAIQSGASDQISIGAVNDGYPLLPAIDPNDDGRFTIRELRTLVDRLRKFDRNQDGSLTADEARATVRICFGLGPHVHRELAMLRSVNPQPDTAIVKGPEWFVRMDRNKDNDLTRGEFPGTDEQFVTLDADQDKLISAQEANQFEKQSGNAKKDPMPPDVKPETESSAETE